MEELVKAVAERTGIGEDKARTAVQTVVAFLKDRLPGSVSQHLDSVISGSPNSVAQSMMGDLGKGVGGMFSS